MEPELIGAIIGGIIGITGGVFPTLLFHIFEKRRRRKTTTRIIAAEITAIKEKAERFIKGQSNLEELKASTPLWSTSLALELGFISANQAVAARRAVTLDMEMRTTGRKDKAEQCIEACKLVLKLL